MDANSYESSPISAMEQEHARLHMVVNVIREQLERLGAIPRYFPADSEEPQTADEVAQQAVDAMRDSRMEQLRMAALEPHFGRIDFAETGIRRSSEDFEYGSRPREFSGAATYDGMEAGNRNKDVASHSVMPLYIGKRGVENDDGERIVIDWRAPIASIFYSFSGKGHQASYEAPEGMIEGEVYLKRNILIRNQAIVRVVDSYTRGQEDNLGVTDEFLLYRLSEQKDNRLRDIVSTIQAEQDQIIRANRQLAVVIQGVAGSGKTTVALHRVAYLLYQHAERLKAERMVIFAPNAMFVDYISEVLPELGVGGIRQTTFAAFAVEMLGNTVKLRDPARRLSRWFGLKSADAEREARDAAAFKGSDAFRDLLDLQVRTFLQTGLPTGDFSPWEGAVLPEATIRSWYAKDYAQSPPALRRQRVLARVKRWYEMEYRNIRASDAKQTRKKTAASRFRTYSKRWPLPSIFNLYRDAWHAAVHLGMTAQAQIGQAKRPNVEVEDLAGLLYLQMRLYGMTDIDTFHHVVIDEAQDFSPLQLWVVRECCPSGSFSILGDLAQSIHTYQGITNWDKFMGQFPTDKVRYYQLDVSYRSTMEIIEFANSILRPFPGFAAAKPVFRSGRPVVVRRVENVQRIAEAADTVMEWINGSHGANAMDESDEFAISTIAVVCRTDDMAEKYHRGLREKGIESHLIQASEEHYAGGISVITVYLTKGLEFDAVLIVDVGVAEYEQSIDDAKLLYVGCTRALHQLRIHYTGEPSKLLQGAGSEVLAAVVG